MRFARLRDAIEAKMVEEGKALGSVGSTDVTKQSSGLVRSKTGKKATAESKGKKRNLDEGVSADEEESFEPSVKAEDACRGDTAL